MFQENPKNSTGLKMKASNKAALLCVAVGVLSALPASAVRDSVLFFGSDEADFCSNQKRGLIVKTNLVLHKICNALSKRRSGRGEVEALPAGGTGPSLALRAWVTCGAGRGPLIPSTFEFRRQRRGDAQWCLQQPAFGGNVTL